MHVWFRQYAQQMGMQYTRAILPEQIDNFINTSTMDVVDEIIKANVGITTDRAIVDNTKLAGLNSLRTLYKSDTFVLCTDKSTGGAVSIYKNNPIVFNTSDYFDNISPLYYIDFSIRYSKVLIEHEDETIIESDLTRWFPIRIIDDSNLSKVLNDWILAPRMRTPVMVMHAGETVANSVIEIYVGENTDNSVSDLTDDYYVGLLKIAYIKKPAIVKYVSDIVGDDSQNVDSDLPEQLQIPMLKHAVDLYRLAINGALFNGQQEENDNNNSRQ